MQPVGSFFFRCVGQFLWLKMLFCWGLMRRHSTLSSLNLDLGLGREQRRQHWHVRFFALGLRVLCSTLSMPAPVVWVQPMTWRSNRC